MGAGVGRRPGLRRVETVSIRTEDMQLREEHWVIADLIGKGRHISPDVPAACGPGQAAEPSATARHGLPVPQPIPSPRLRATAGSPLRVFHRFAQMSILRSTGLFVVKNQSLNRSWGSSLSNLLRPSLEIRNFLYPYSERILSHKST